MKASRADIDELERKGATVGPALNLDIPRARGRTTRHEIGRMNKMEEAWACELDARKDVPMGNPVVSYWFEGIKLRLADKTFYTPDFMVLMADGLVELHDCKGFMEDDAAVKIKVAAAQFPLFQFVLVTKRNKAWKEERYR